MLHDFQTEDLPRGLFFDADTGACLSPVFRYDDETGDYRYGVIGPSGQFKIDAQTARPVELHGCCRLRFVPFDSDGNLDETRAWEMPKKITFREFL